MRFTKQKLVKCLIAFAIITFVMLLLFKFFKLLYKNKRCIEGFTLDIENDTDMTERSEKYEKLMNEFYEKKKKSREHINILDELSTETDWYEMNEYEMSLLTGVSITTLRNNRRSTITTPRWPYRKGDGRANGALVTYVLGEVKTKLASS